MDTSRATPADRGRFELRYRSLSPHRCGFAFPCDENGRVDLDELSDAARENYLYARAVVGRDLLHPQVLMVHGRLSGEGAAQRGPGAGEARSGPAAAGTGSGPAEPSAVAENSMTCHRSWAASLASACLLLVHGMREGDKAICVPCIGWIALDAAIVPGVLRHG